MKKLRIYVDTSAVGMMKKTFDCVQMKDRIQQRLRNQEAGQTPGQIRAEIQDTLSRSHSPIGELWRSLLQKSHLRVAEPSEKYGSRSAKGHA